MIWIYDLTCEQLKNALFIAGMKPFVTDQVFQWLYGKNQPDIAEWLNISKTNRSTLAQTYDTKPITAIDISKDDQGTKKILFQLADNYRVESVLIKEKTHYTFCISTQVGCALKCSFCATGAMGFKRDLTAGEILCQVLMLKKELVQYTGKINLVFMGMGEPLLNYDNLKQAIEIITAEKGIGISPRNITISTAGILENIIRFETDFPRVKISFSLNGSSSAMREELMPISKKEKLTDILNYFRSTAGQRKHRITFEYVMLKGINDSLKDAAKIVKLLHGIPCKINLIPYNPTAAIAYKTPDVKTVEAFDDYLHSKGHTVIVRWSKGKNIKSACGQLAAETTNPPPAAKKQDKDIS